VLALEPPADLVMAWLFNDVPARRGLAVAWLERGASAEGFLESGVPAAVLTSPREEEPFMAAVMIGVDPHKASHTAVAISGAEEPLGELRVRASAVQAERLLEWAAAWPQRTWAVEGAGGLGHLLAQQLLSAGERVLDVQPKLGARVRLLAAGNVNKNDPNDARSVAVAAPPSPRSASRTARAAPTTTRNSPRARPTGKPSAP